MPNHSQQPTKDAALRALAVFSLWLKRTPRPISPRTHAYFDALAFPAIMGLAAWMWRRNHRAGLLIAANGLLEGTTAATTNFPPPGPFPLLDFRTHVRIGLLGAPVFLALGSLVPGIPWAERRVVMLMGLVPLVVNGLSDTRPSADSLGTH